MSSINLNLVTEKLIRGSPSKRLISKWTFEEVDLNIFKNFI